MPLPLRPYVIEEYTKTVCPACAAARILRPDDPRTWKDGMLVSRDGSVWMRRFCSEHGETESLYEEDSALWKARHGWSAPTSTVVPDRPGNDRAFPEGYQDGLPSGHGQHTCILLLNVTEHCNLNCPTCYASALPPGSAAPPIETPSIDEICRTIDTVTDREAGRLGVLMLSGGEPTVRRDLGEILESTASKPVTRILLNTNGRRIARDDGFAVQLARFKDRVEAYLQFDGLRPSTYLALRGQDLASEKLAALARLSETGVPTTLVMTVKRGVNEDEVGEVARLAMSTPSCVGLAFQPVFGSGRSDEIDPMDRATPTGVLKRLERQTEGAVKAVDFVPLPCSHRDCCDIAYYLKDKQGAWKSLPDTIGRDELKSWIHLAANTISFEDASDAVKALVRDGALARVFSESQKTGSLALAGDLFRLCGCVPGVVELLGLAQAKKAEAMIADLARRTFRMTVKMFMDAHTFHEARIRQCCVHTGSFEEDPRRTPFCWRWLFPESTDFPDRDGLTPLRTVT
ncbi:MAG: radical SAM protein [Armatimonadetes bacterium]|nr:radical SAM protein [Armatimonadota bacterium]